MLLLHGTPGHCSTFERLADHLAAQSYFVLAPNMPGYGASPPIEYHRGHHDALDVLIAELARRGISELSVVGFSLGAYYALSLALAGTPRIRSVVTLGACAARSADDRAGMAGFAAMLREGIDSTAPEFRTLFVERMLSPGFIAANPSVASEVADWLNLTPAAVVAADLQATSESRDLLPELARLQVPITLRVGASDVATPVAYSRAIAEVAPHAELQVVPHAGHCLLIEDWADTSAAIADALARGLAPCGTAG